MKANFRKKLSIATSLLLGSNAVCHASSLEAKTQTDYSFLNYAETNGVSVTAPQFTIKQKLNDDNSVSANIIYDTVSGNSPTGEVPTGTVQTVTSTSGRTSTISATAKPKKSFSDVRTAISLGWQHSFNRLIKTSNSISFSQENDYQSNTLSSSFSKDSEDRLTTWSVGGAVSADTITATDKLDGVAGIPKTLTNISNKERSALSENKSSKELKLGVTQVLTKRSLLLLSYTKSISSGYHNDPYKVVSVVDSGGNSLASLYESRPESRDRDIVTLGYIHNIDGHVFKLNYRYFNDDWQIQSHTIDSKIRFKLTREFALEPHVRFYTQSAAYFHNYYILDSNINNVASYISADSRLANFNSTTFGVKGSYTSDKFALTARIENMQQFSNQNTSSAPGKLSQYNLFSDKDVLIFNFSFSMLF